MKLLNYVLLLAFVLPVNIVSAQLNDFTGGTLLRPMLASQKLNELVLPNDKNTVNPEEVYSVLMIEAALTEENFEAAAQEALNFTKYHRINPSIVEFAVSYYYAKGDYERAYDAIRHWYKHDSDSEVVRNLHTLLLGQTGRDKEFLQALKRNLKNVRTEHFTEKLYENATILEELKDRNKALQHFETITAPFDLENADYHILYADFAMRADQVELAWSEAFKAVDLDAQSDAAVLRILALSQGPRRTQGLHFVRDFLHKNPNNRILYLSYINELGKDNNYEDSIKEIKLMQKYAPEDFELLYFQALIHYDAKQWINARRVLTQFIDIQNQRKASLPKESSTADEMLFDARKLMIAIYKAEKKYRSALNQLNLISTELLDANLLMEKAELLTHTGSVSEGLRVLEKAAIAFPESRGNFLWFGGNLLNESGRTDQAIVYYNDALKELPDSADIKYALAMLYEKRGEIWPAEMLLREVIKTEPDMADGYNALGYIFADRNYNLDEAAILLNQAVNLAPHNPYILDSMGWLQFRLKNYNLALEYLEKAFDLDRQAEIAAHLADVYVAIGEFKRAEEMVRIGIQIDKNNRVLQDTMRRLNLGNTGASTK